MDYLLPLICTLIGIAGVVFSIIIAGIVRSAPAGNEKMQEIGQAVREGAMAFLTREYKVLTIFVIAVAILLLLGNYSQGTSLVAASFIVGAFCSGLAGFFGMRVATLANNRTTHAARSSLN